MKQAALFFDIDETLLSSVTGEIPASAIKALDVARENGHLLFINTGRTLCSIPPEIKRMKFDGLLCGCGTYLLYGDEVLFSSHISDSRGAEIIDKLKECCIDGILEGTDDIYFSARISRFERLESTRRYMASMGLGVETAMEEKDFQFDKMLIYTDEKDTGSKMRLLGFLKEDILPLDRGEGIYECVQKAYSKATAIEHMRAHLGLELDQIYVFGDSSNDLAMFEYAQHSVAMGKHDEVLDEYTEYVTAKVEEDGIYQAMKHYGLI